MLKLAFHNGKFICASGDDMPTFPGIDDEVVITTLPDGETFSTEHEYSYEEIDGELIAIKGDLIPIDPVEEQRKWDEGQLVRYKNQRASSDGGYPAIGDQLDALFHAGVFPDEMAAKIQAIKDKFPKPE